MEFLNKIELRGVVGRADINSYNGHHVCNFSVVTENTAVDRELGTTVETMWFNVSAWDGVQGIEDFTLIQKGGWVSVIGRLYVRKYVTQDNVERFSLEVKARRVQVLPKEDLQMSPQRDY